MLVQYLLYPTVVSAFLRLDLNIARSLIVEILVAQIRGPREKLGGLFG